MCYNYKTKYTEWCPIPSDGGWGMYVKTWLKGPINDFDQLEQRLSVYNESVLTRFSHGPDDRIIMELQCTNYFVVK